MENNRPPDNGFCMQPLPVTAEPGRVPYQKKKNHIKTKHPNQVLLKLKEICAKPYLTVLEIAYLDYSRYLDDFPFIKHNFLSMTYKIVMKNPQSLKRLYSTTCCSPPL